MSATGAWPAGVIARYLTVGGGHVDLTHQSLFVTTDELAATQARCGVCQASHTEEWAAWVTTSTADAAAGDWAQAHAESCRAVPRPEAVR